MLMELEEFAVKRSTSSVNLGLRMPRLFHERIAAMNAMYRLTAHDKPRIPDNVGERLAMFKATLMDEEIGRAHV